MLTAIVIGGAACVWDDVARALDLFEPGLIVAVNDVGASWPGPVNVWCSLHPDKLPAWRAERARRGFPRADEHLCHVTGKDEPGADRQVEYRLPGQTSSGSSGLFGVKVALDAGAERVVIAGIPLSTGGAHFFDPKPWTARDGFVKGWQEARPAIADKVRSMSGFTMKLLGAPTPQWLAGA
ncbi:hypothetical protein [Xanthobacter tagetidis]|uniref:Uncharacterized protein n=1 Tax=Xanthobacter tagetidis TaxID=60216 RepID=A0A3L7AJ96_9HYPH|nr:hypothetical protein [Xanthobacter tagetidis]MBB6306230.1 hypothetical protein [Xanthobacter tagetidis]RLP79512.1 hypothetical protein D9R14_07555 [Xanthobacter tagetidis]